MSRSGIGLAIGGRGQSPGIQLPITLLLLIATGCGVDTVAPDSEPPAVSTEVSAVASPSLLARDGVIGSVSYTVKRSGSLLAPPVANDQMGEIGLVVRYEEGTNSSERLVLEFDDPSFPGNWDQPSVDVGRVELIDGSIRVWSRRGVLKSDLPSDLPISAITRDQPWDTHGNVTTNNVPSREEMVRARWRTLAPDPNDVEWILAQLRSSSDSERVLPNGILEFTASQGNLRSTTRFDPRVGATISSVTEEAGRMVARMQYDYGYDSDGLPRLTVIRTETFDESGNLRTVSERALESLAIRTGGE